MNFKMYRFAKGRKKIKHIRIIFRLLNCYCYLNRKNCLNDCMLFLINFGPLKEFQCAGLNLGIKTCFQVESPDSCSKGWSTRNSLRKKKSEYQHFMMLGGFLVFMRGDLINLLTTAYIYFWGFYTFIWQGQNSKQSRKESRGRPGHLGWLHDNYRPSPHPRKKKKKTSCDWISHFSINTLHRGEFCTYKPFAGLSDTRASCSFHDRLIYGSFSWLIE